MPQFTTVALALSMLLSTSWAGQTTAVERSQIEAEMQRLTGVFAAEESACTQRFLVTSCVEDVQLRRREALARERARLLALDDEDRRQRAGARLAAIESKRQAQRNSVPEPQPQRSAVERVPAAAASVPLTAVRRGQAGPSRQEAASAAAAQRVVAARRRQQEVEAHANEVRQKLLERERSGKAAAPLPAPAASR
ncbi:MAG TPA: hypothetical protein VEZ89_02405 [Rubrivivax sp.]|nr:hypothetical protein [Rubrivivax sp.]